MKKFIFAIGIIWGMFCQGQIIHLCHADESKIKQTMLDGFNVKLSKDEEKALFKLAQKFNKEQPIIQIVFESLFHPGRSLFACVEFKPKPLNLPFFETSRFCAMHRNWISGRGEKSSGYLKRFHQKDPIITDGPWLTIRSLYSIEKKCRFLIDQKEYFIRLEDTEDYSKVASLLIALSHNKYSREHKTRFLSTIPLGQITSVRRVRGSYDVINYVVTLIPARWVWTRLTFEEKRNKWVLIDEHTAGA